MFIITAIIIMLVLLRMQLWSCGKGILCHVHFIDEDIGITVIKQFIINYAAYKW